MEIPEEILFLIIFLAFVIIVNYIRNLYCKLQWLHKMKYSDTFLYNDYLCKYVKMIGHNVVFRYYYNNKLDYVYYTKVKKL